MKKCLKSKKIKLDTKKWLNPNDMNEPIGVQLARAHWMQLHKLNLQVCFIFNNNAYVTFQITPKCDI